MANIERHAKITILSYHASTIMELKYLLNTWLGSKVYFHILGHVSICVWRRGIWKQMGRGTKQGRPWVRA